MLVLAIGGFWPQYFAAVTGRATTPTTQFWLIHVHAALFTVWLLLYISQAALIMGGHARVHLKIGPWLAAYGFAIAAVGITQQHSSRIGSECAKTTSMQERRSSSTH